MTRWSRLAAGLGAGAMLVVTAACGGGASSPTTKSSSPAPSAASSASTSASSSSGVIRLGLIFPLTGALAKEGNDAYDGARTELARINYQVDGHKIQVFAVDSQGTAATALTKTKQLVEQDHVNVIEGFVNTDACYAGATYIKQAHVPAIMTGDCGAQDLTYNPKFASPYLFRTSQIGNEINGAMAKYVYSAGFKNVLTIGADYAGGTESIGAFDWNYIQLGGRVTQEFWPPLGTPDYGSYLSQIKPGTKAIVAFLPGIDGLHFVEQAHSYGVKAQIFDLFGVMTGGTNLRILKNDALGIIADGTSSTAETTPAFKTFAAAFAKQYPKSLVSPDVVNGYSGVQFLVSALRKLHGDISNQQKFLQALASTKVNAAKGPVSLDSRHDVIQNIYAYKIVSNGSGGYAEQLLHTYPHVSMTWIHTLAQIKKFPWTNVKGRFVNVSKSQLASMGL